MTPSSIMARLPTGGDLVEELTKLVTARNLTRGGIMVVGALRKARLGYYRQEKQEYVALAVDRPVEIAAGMGNISVKDGKPFVHLHLVLSGEDGSCLGGHAMPGCEVFAAEAVMRGLDGDPLVREHDAATGLFLWAQGE
jgi:predicted DNA-binding protein with PD1-like motif